MADDDRFLGTWTLLTELSLYETGTPPASGTYTISEPTAGVLTLHVAWRMEPEGDLRVTSFGGPCDGTPQPLPMPPGVTTRSAGIPDALTLTRVDASTLDSAALVEGRVVAYARRVVSRDGTLLAVAQDAIGGEGNRARNFHVYRRSD